MRQPDDRSTGAVWGPDPFPRSQPPPPPDSGVVAVRPGLPPELRGRQLASWGRRALALIVDWLISSLVQTPGSILFVVGLGPALQRYFGVSNDQPVRVVPVVTGLLLIALGAVFNWWNLGWRQGTTGRSIGKGLMRLRLVRIHDSAPLGGAMGLLREVIRTGASGSLGGVWLILTFAWPLGDERRQTLEDKMLGTVVISER